jgi:hypothetical protein
VKSTLKSSRQIMFMPRFAGIARVWVLTMMTGAAPLSLGAQECPDPAALTRGFSGAQATVRFLADDALQGRLAGTPGERCAGDFIAARFRELALKPGGEAGSFFQQFPLASVLNPHALSGTGRNVIALLEGSDLALKDEWIIVGAHYDHLGHGELGSMATGAEKAAIHNGADDNASGVAVMLEVARWLKAARPARSIAFIAFSGEESGLLGSAHFAAHSTIDLKRTRAMINLDMVGRLGAGPLIIYGAGTATEWQDILAAVTSAERVPFRAQAEGTGPSDHTSFYLKDIPVLHFFTNVHTDYHKPSDDWERIDRPGLERVTAVVTGVARRIAGREQVLTLVRGVGRPPAPAGQRLAYNTYLGTVPDFAPVPRGVPLSGVTSGSPADKAGLKGGDIVIRFDNDEIADLEGMTEGLRKRKPGDSVRVTVLRDGKELVVTAVLGTRN